MNIKPIRSESDYRNTLEQIETLMDAGGNRPEGNLLDVLVTSVEAYERKAYPLDLPEPA